MENKFNLFWGTRNLTKAREDHLTEFIAGAIKLSTEFREKFIEYVLGGFVAEKNWELPQVKEVSTQVAFPGTSCCPDMKVQLMDGHEIIFENKLAAGETEGPEGRGQLERYIELPVDGLVYIRADWDKVSRKILKNHKYVNHPEGKPHFLWRDFYPIVNSVGGEFMNWLKEGFEKYGFVPPPDSIGELFDNEGNEIIPNQKEFGKYWDKTKKVARELGWKVGIGRRFQLYLNKISDNRQIFICPCYSGYPRFKIQIDTENMKASEELINKLEKIIEDENVEFEKDRRVNGVSIVNVLTTLNNVVGDASGASEIEGALYYFVKPILKTV